MHVSRKSEPKKKLHKSAEILIKQRQEGQGSTKVPRFRECFGQCRVTSCAVKLATQDKSLIFSCQ